jgi:hypothetical protein
MSDFIFYAQILVLILNCVVFVFLMQTENVNYKLARIVLLVAISVGTVINFGKVTIFTILFSFAPFLSLININQHGKIHRLIERIRDIIWSNKQPLQKL